MQGRSNLKFVTLLQLLLTLVSSHQPGASSQGGGINTGARQDPEEHTGGGLNLIFVIIPVVAVVVITAIVVIAILVCRR